MSDCSLIIRRFLLVLTFILAPFTPARAQENQENQENQDEQKPQALTIGQSHALSTHDAERHINVILPAGYHEGKTNYPVVLMLDGGIEQDLFLALGMQRWNQLWGRSEPAIFVGVQTVDRQRELLPPTQMKAERDRYPTAGESTLFREWLAASVLPLVRDQYRDDGRAYLIGESAAGHFVAETWLRDPELFDGYAAISPSFQWNDQWLVGQLETLDKAARPKLFLSVANEGGATEDGIIRFAFAAGENICFSDRRNELVHANVLHGLLPEALQFLLPTKADWLEEYGLKLRCNAVPDREKTGLAN